MSECNYCSASIEDGVFRDGHIYCGNNCYDRMVEESSQHREMKDKLPFFDKDLLSSIIESGIELSDKKLSKNYLVIGEAGWNEYSLDFYDDLEDVANMVNFYTSNHGEGEWHLNRVYDLKNKKLLNYKKQVTISINGQIFNF